MPTTGPLPAYQENKQQPRKHRPPTNSSEIGTSTYVLNETKTSSGSWQNDSQDRTIRTHVYVAENKPSPTPTDGSEVFIFYFFLVSWHHIQITPSSKVLSPPADQPTGLGSLGADTNWDWFGSKDGTRLYQCRFILGLSYDTYGMVLLLPGCTG